MAKIWLAREGNNPTGDKPLAERPPAWCEANLGLRKSSQRSAPPRLGTGDIPGLNDYRQYSYVVVEIAEGEGQYWEPGFYPARVTPSDAIAACKA